MKKFKDDEQRHIESDIEKVQVSTGMYIGSVGPTAALHLCRELINNNIDEMTNEDTIGDTIETVLDTKTNLFTTRDNGRGIPFESLENVCTKLQAGSKLTREGSAGAGAGQNGVGLTASNALASHFEISSTRYGEKRTLVFKDGKMVSDKTVKADPSLHGTSVSIIPSEFYLANHGDGCQIDHVKLIDWVDIISHLIPTGITIKSQVVLDKEKNITKKFTNKNGLVGLLQRMVDKPLLEPIVVKDIYKFKEDDRGKLLDRYIGLEAAITFVSESNAKLIDSYCNFVHTIDGGSHVDAVTQACVKYFLQETRGKMSEGELKKYEPKRIDVINSLALSVNVLTNTQPHYSGQSKEKVTSRIFTKVFSEMGMVYRNLVDHFKNNPRQLEKAIDIIKLNAKARVKSSELREVEYKKSKTINTDLRKSKKFIRGHVTTKNEYSELLIVEGDSAAGGIESKRFPFQDALLLRGVPINAMNAKVTRVLANAEMDLIVQAMRANYGSKFSIEEAWYDKVIIMSDGDSDGNNIFSSTCVFFMLYMREFVEEGRVYRALPPLYKINDKKNPFIKNKAEYFQVYVDRVKNNIMIESSEKLLSTKDMQEFFYSNRDYLDELRDLSKYFGIHPYLTEFLCKHWGNKNFEKMLKKRFPEMTVDGDIVQGVYEGMYQFIIINKRFGKNSNKFIEILTNPCNTSDLYKISKKTSIKPETLGEMTIAELLTLCEQYSPKIMQRYKGLGEITPTEFRETVLDPNNRQLIRLTVSDYERALEAMKVLHDDSPRSSKARKELIASYSIRKDELDN